MEYHGAYITPDGHLRYVAVADDGPTGMEWRGEAARFADEAVARFAASMARYMDHGAPGEDGRTFSAVRAR